MSKYDQARFFQLRNLVINTISPMGSYSAKAVTAIMMIIAHESKRGTLREQVISFNQVEDNLYKTSGKPYASGICGMEKPTHDDLWIHSDNIERDYFEVFKTNNIENIQFDRLVYDDKYSIFMARKKLHMIPQAIPQNSEDIAKYLVKFYNAGGKASKDGYLNDYLDWYSIV